MNNQAVFKRYELKYMLTWQQKQALLQAMAPYMALDRYGHATIRNLYFDTPSYQLIRRSLEKPVYKEKLRLRGYGDPLPEGPAFVELKKKFDGVVYKRRVTMPLPEAMAWLTETGEKPAGQIPNEINWFLGHYPQLKPKVFLSYEREAYYCREGGDFRVTFDEHILARQDALALDAPIGGTSLLEAGKVLMEIKTAGGIPLWMVRALSEARAYKTSFSKYGTAYQTMIFPNYKGGCLYV